MSKIKKRTPEEIIEIKKRPTAKVDFEPMLKEIRERNKKALRELYNIGG